MAGWITRHARALPVIIGLAAALFLIGCLLALAGRSRASSNQPSCGVVANGSSYHTEPIDCLWRAYQAHQSAQAVMVDITVEGDPITYTVDLIGSEINVRIDSKDRFGPRGQFVYGCSGFARKTSTNNSGHAYLVATGCTGPQGYVDDGGKVTIP